MPPDTRLLGPAAEAWAAHHLESRGLRIIARNLYCRAGELDLVCLDGTTLVIVEVRLRGRAEFGNALASVTRRKQQKMIRATRFHWQRRKEWHTRRLRFDVVALQARQDGVYVAQWIKDAFRLI